MPRLSIFQSLSIRAYRYYYVTVMSQTAAISMQATARGILMYRLTGRVELLGVMLLAHAIPSMLLSLFGGVIADRLPKKAVIIMGQFGFLVTALVVALTLSFGVLSSENENSWWILIGVTIVRGAIEGLVAPSRSALAAELVGQEMVMNAISLRTMGRNVMRLVLPALAGWLITLYGFAIVYWVQVVMLLVSMTATYRLPFIHVERTKRFGVMDQLKHGLRYAAREKSILYTLLIAMLLSLATMPYMQLMPVFVEDILKVGTTGLGILHSVSAAGAMIGALILAGLPNKKRGLLLVLSGLFLAIFIAGFAFNGSWPVAIVLMLFIGIGSTARRTLAVTLLQTNSSATYRGRVMSLYQMEGGVTGFGGFLASMLAAVIGVQLAVGGIAIVLIVCLVLILLFVPQIRKLN
jgi:MFS family permease